MMHPNQIHMITLETIRIYWHHMKSITKKLWGCEPQIMFGNCTTVLNMTDISI